MIWSATTCRIVDSSKPWFSEGRNDVSRFGPTFPVAFASASVWQAAHFSVKSCLPADLSALAGNDGADAGAAARGGKRENGEPGGGRSSHYWLVAPIVAIASSRDG